MIRRRFTLTEVLIAVALFAMMAALASASIARTVKSWTSTKKRVNQLNELIFMEKVLQPMVYNSIAFNWKIEDEYQDFFFGQSDYCRLVYRHALRELDEGSLRFAELTLVDGQLLVRYSSRPWIDGEEPVFEEDSTSVLTKNVESLEIFYAGENEENDKAIEWFQEWELPQQPLAMRIRITWENGIEENFLWRCGGNSSYMRHFSQKIKRT
jgi:hypothetical protein